MTDHSQDDWHLDSGMYGVRVRVVNGGMQMNRYAPDVSQMRCPEVVLRAFLLDMDRDWKRGCEEVQR